MSKPIVHGVTVSVDFGDKEFGNGSNSYMNIQARYPDPGKPVSELGDVVVQGLDLYFAAWKTMLSSRYATGVISGPDFKAALEAAEKKLAKVRAYLAKEAAGE